MEINLSKLRELYSTTPTNVSKQEIGTKQIIRKDTDYSVFEKAILTAAGIPPYRIARIHWDIF